MTDAYGLRGRFDSIAFGRDPSFENEVYCFMKPIGALLLLSGILGCSHALVPRAGNHAVTVSACVGPATSLPDSLAATLPVRDGRSMPDDQWADLAAVVPGGFAGIFYDRGKPVLALARPDEAAAAKAALAPKLSFPIGTAEVRGVRWDFAQLVNWSNYILGR